MSEKNIDQMKKIIEAKKNSSSSQSSAERAKKTIGSSHKAFKSLKKGGAIDK